jgi:hypothetical protein
MGVEAVFIDTAPGYRLPQAGKTAAVRGGGLERVLEGVGRELSGLPVYVGVGVT